ncbi:MAG: hypothetical protein H0U42_09075 [Thermoleophilaceae bacterium]|nr:hypothetical protein [Thermoleophilaceae bacterium]
MNEPRSEAMPRWLIAVAFLGAASALLGGFWDDSWHTERGRDSFFIAPHIAIYAGVSSVGAALGLWVLRVAHRDGVGAALRNPLLVLASVSVAVTLASAPIDNFWHEAFGRDAVAWSPPHMLGIVGMLGLSAALLAMLADRPVLGPAAGALVFAAATFSVFEYDTDVPQFDAVWYLPVLCFGAALAAVLVQLTGSRRWSVGAAAIGHLTFLAGASLFLFVIGFPPIALPLLVFPALALDFARHRDWGVAIQTAIFVGVLYAAYVPVRNFLGDGVFIDSLDVALGLPLALVVVGGVFYFAADRSGRHRRGRGARTPAAGACLLVALIIAPVASAHDPGQGDPAGTMRLTLTTRAGVVQLAGAWNSPACAQPERGELIARRGGQELRAPLRVRSCAFEGRVALPDRGRWFVYAELQTGGRVVESWLPVAVTAQPKRVSDSARYAYEPPSARPTALTKYLTGAALYGAMATLLLATIAVLRRRSSWSHPT